MSEYGILTDNVGKLGSMYYYYYMIAAFRILRFDTIDYFSKKFLSKTSGENSDNLRNFTDAMNEFGRGNFSEALRRISMMKQVSVFINFFIREFKSFCFYELNELQLFESEHKTLYHLLKKHQLHFPKMKEELDFQFRTVRYLFSLREKFEFSLFKKLEQSIPKSRIWLLQKLKEIHED